MPDDQRYGCTRCTRTDLTLTVNGRVRSHAANGKRAGADNPHCPGGSDFPKHDHNFENWSEDEGGYVCTVCGETDPRPTEKDVRNAEYVGTAGGDVPDSVEAEADAILSRATEYGIRPDAVDMPTSTSGGPNPHRSPLSTGSEAQDRARGIPSPPVSPPTADEFMGSDQPEGDSSPSYFPARYDGDCDTCGRDFAEGDMIRKAPGGGWEAEECCGGEIDEEAEQRPRSRAPQLPVRNGRYQGPHPETGQPTSFTRTTTFNGVIADNFALKLWEERMGAMGFVKRPDLLERVAHLLKENGGVPYEVAKIQREVLNKIFEDAKLAAGSKDRARKGTILHKHTQEVDMGRKSLGDVPEEFRWSVSAYLTAMADSGLECVPDLIERSTSYIFGKRLALQVAGTFDRVLRVTKELSGTLDSGRTVTLHPGEHVIGDVKSGQDLSYAWDEIEIQEAIYAHGVAEFGVAVPERGPQGTPTWRWADLAEFGIDNLRLDVGIVMHAPYGETSCDLYFADLISGWSGAKICTTVSDRRTRDVGMTPVRQYVTGEKPVKAFEPAGARPVANVELPPAGVRSVPVGIDPSGEGAVVAASPAKVPGGVPTPVKGAKRTWEDVAREVSTREEANKVWAEMRKRVAVLGMDRITTVVGIMKETLREKGAV